MVGCPKEPDDAKLLFHLAVDKIDEAFNCSRMTNTATLLLQPIGGQRMRWCAAWAPR